MPVVYWWKVEKSNNALDLIKGTKTTSKRILIHCAKQWLILNDYFTDYFGIQSKQRKYLKLIARHQECVTMFAITKNHLWITRRLFIEQEIERVKPKDGKAINEYEELRNISMSLEGAVMDPKTMSTIQYYSDFGLAIKFNKKTAAANRTKNKR